MIDTTNDLELPAGGVGVFGGTFNPIHMGHLRAAQEVMDQLDLARVIFIPNARPPHKPTQQPGELAAAADRLAWTRLAVAQNPDFEVDPIEIERQGPSFAVDTLRTIHERIAPLRPVFIIGRDAFVEIATWREPQTLFELANFAVMTRPPIDDDNLSDWLPIALQSEFKMSVDGQSARHRYADTWIRGLQITPIDVSSSEIRSRIGQGEAANEWVPASVYDAILESGNYRDPDASPLQTAASIGDDQRGRARQAVGAASEIQAENPVALDVREVTAFADTFVLLTGRSNRQVKSIADAVARAMSKNGEKPLGVEGYDEGHWVLMDFADLIVHIFGPDARQEYDLERLWSDAPRIDVGLADFYPSAEAKQ